jgi:hypothetical protein
MKKLTLIAALFVAALFTTTPAHAFLLNWNFDGDGAGVLSKTLILEYMDTVGNTRVAFGGGGTTFTEQAVFSSATHDGLGATLGNYGTNAPELTAVFTGAGTVAFGSSFTFTSGTLTMYSDPLKDYATSSANTYEAANGTQIGQFSLLSGGGSVDITGVPNGQITTLLKATSLAPGYWYMPDGTTDLSTMLGGSNLVLGFATTNGSALQNPNANLVGALGPQAANVLYLSNNGQYRLNVVPEPATMLLFGIGAAGMAMIRRKKMVV